MNIPLLKQLRDLRKSSRRYSASMISTYSVNLPFYENVVLRALQAAGIRFNVLLVDARELGAALLVDSTRPMQAGREYVLIPVHAAGAFHPKVFSLFSERGMAVAVGSHNLTEAGLGHNGEISTTFGFGTDPAPLNISSAVAQFLIQCAGELAPGDARLTRKVTDKLLSLANEGVEGDEDEKFFGSMPEDDLLARAFGDSELPGARRIMVLGPYFDSALKFLATLRERASRADITVAVQSKHAVIKRADRIPERTRICDLDQIRFPGRRHFVHAKALLVETRDQRLLALGSANPSKQAWLEDRAMGNFEAIVVFRGGAADRAIDQLGLDKLWEAPLLSQEQLKQVMIRSRTVPEKPEDRGPLPIAGLWREGSVEARVGENLGNVRAIRKQVGSTSMPLNLQGASLHRGVLKFLTNEAGIFEIEFVGRRETIVVVATSIAAIASSLISNQTSRLIDELDRLNGGAAPGEELLSLFEKIFLEKDDERPTQPRRRRGGGGEDDNEASGPRGISISETRSHARGSVGVSLDISAIITALLKELSSKRGEKPEADPEGTENPEDEEAIETPTVAANRRWEDIVRAVRPRVRRVLNKLAERLAEKREPSWKYERALVTLALMKRLRKFHPGETIPFSGIPERLVEVSDVRLMLKLAISCWFARETGVVATLAREGGVEIDYENIGRALLFWAAYEAGLDAAQPPKPSLDPGLLRELQADRTDALIAAIAASAGQATLDRARREIFDRGQWNEFLDQQERIGAWFERHTRIGQAFQTAIAPRKSPGLPTLRRPGSLQDVLVWREEPAWPRLAQSVSAGAIHLADVGDAETIKVKPQFVEPVDLDALGIRSLIMPSAPRMGAR